MVRTEPKRDERFFPTQFTCMNLDIYIVRRSIVTALESAMPFLKGIILDVGCGDMPYRSFILNQCSDRVQQYVGLDLRNDRYSPPTIYWDGLAMPIGNEKVDTVIATEVLEHCPHPDRVLKEIIRVLKPNGLFFFTVPFLWPLHDVPHDEYRYTPFALHRLLREAGFSDIRIKPLGGWDASLAQMIGLWARRRPMSEWKRKCVLSIAVPIMRWLLLHDHQPAFEEAPMITGLYGTAYKPSTP